MEAITRVTLTSFFKGYPDVMNAEQVGGLLGISKKTVYKLVHAGDLPAVKVGREYRVPKINLIRYMKMTGITPAAGNIQN